MPPHLITQGCTIPMCQVTTATKHCALAPKILQVLIQELTSNNPSSWGGSWSSGKCVHPCYNTQLFEMFHSTM